MTPLVLVHGFMGGAAQWDGQCAAFADAYDVIAIGLPGFGAQAHQPALHTIGDFADWVIDNLRRRGIHRYHMLGHSMGGMIAQEIARRDAAHVERLVLYGTGAVGVLPGRFETIAQSKARAMSDGAQATARRISATWFLQRETSPAFEACAKIAQQAAPAAILAGLDAMQAWSGADQLLTIKPKTLVIWGDQDRTYPWQQTELLWSSIPQACLAVVPNAAHAVHLEKPDLFNAVLRDFLQT